jgi:N6-adenosine-specific RNA methylase IME4
VGHYDTASLDYLKALPVGDLAAPDCALFMWVLDTMVQEALDLGRAWGFTHKTTAFYWSKMKKNASVDLLKPNTIDQLFPIGTGYWTRANPETCMLFTKGSPKRKARDVRRLVNAPRREHSRKPDEVYDRIERLVDGPYLELFARQSRPGWDSWGNETEKFDG